VLATVIRGRIGPDGSSVEFASPTCYPSTPAGCPVDNVRQVGSSIPTAPYTREVDGVVRAYLTTPPQCPKSGAWESGLRFWWADGSGETVVTKHLCTRPA